MTLLSPIFPIGHTSEGQLLNLCYPFWLDVFTLGFCHLEILTFSIFPSGNLPLALPALLSSHYSFVEHWRLTCAQVLRRHGGLRPADAVPLMGSQASVGEGLTDTAAQKKGWGSRASPESHSSPPFPLPHMPGHILRWVVTETEPAEGTPAVLAGVSVGTPEASSDHSLMLCISAPSSNHCWMEVSS